MGVMKFSIREFAVMLLAAAVTVAVLWGGQRLYQNSAIRSPLIRSVDTVPGVQSAEVTALGGLNVRFRPAANLMATYQAVEAKAQLSLGHTPSVTVQNESNRLLQGLANQVRLMVAQGEATGQYVDMSRQISNLAERSGVKATISIGNYNIFVSLRSGQRYYVDAVMPLDLGGADHG